MSRVFVIGRHTAVAVIFAGSTLLAGAAPAAAQGKPVELEGVLQVEVADFPDGTSSLHHFLKTFAGERLELKFKDKGRRPYLVSGTWVKVKGSLADKVLTAEASPAPLDGAAPDGAAALAYAGGAQKAAVILVNFKDKITSPQTPAAVQQLMFGQVNSFLQENSFQTASLTGNVFGWYTIPVASTSCDISAISTQARSAASAAGADLSAYNRFIYIFPNTSACAWAGYGIIGGSPTEAWINGYFDRRIIAHEIGHNLGLHHAHGLNCSSSPIGSTCTTSEYGDPVDTMGWGLYGHFSAYQKELLGWLNANGLPAITTVQSSGSYSIAPYSASSGGARALKILRSTDSISGQKTWYYLEYRQPTGFDAGLANTGNLTAGVGIRTASASDGVSLLDMTTNSNTSSDYNDQLDSTLTVGKSFTDSAAGFTVTVTQADATGATVEVSLAGGGSTACTRARPAVVVSPNQSTSAAAGTALAYNVAVTNNDSSACGSSGFSLGSSIPSGWTGSLGTSSLTVGAGGSGSTTLTVKSPATAAAGSYSVGASAASSASSLSGAGSSTYSVAAGSLSETVSTSQSAYVLGNTVAATATVKLDGVPVANAGVAFKMTKSNGDLVTYNTTTGSSGQASYQYTLSLTDSTGYYRMGATASSSGKTVYTSASFSVGQPTSTAGSLTETVTIAQSSYARGSTANATATVKLNGAPAANASVAFKMTKANGELVNYSTTTNANGQAYYQYQLKSTDPVGYYRVGATATSGGLSSYTSASFQVQ